MILHTNRVSYYKLEKGRISVEKLFVINKKSFIFYLFLYWCPIVILRAYTRKRESLKFIFPCLFSIPVIRSSHQIVYRVISTPLSVFLYPRAFFLYLVKNNIGSFYCYATLYLFFFPIILSFSFLTHTHKCIKCIIEVIVYIYKLTYIEKKH